MTNRDGVAGEGESIRANRYDVLSRLAEDLAHEIKNPLNSIVINLEVLRRLSAAGAREKVLDRSAVIEQEVLRVHALIDEMLQLLRPPRPELEPQSLDAIIGSLQHAIETQAKGARVALHVDVESSLYAQVRAGTFKFALLNLLTRAIDAETSAGGAVMLEAKRVDDHIEVVVSCSHAVLDPADVALEYCRLLLADAGGTFASLEPGSTGSGSITTLVMPPAIFG